MEETSMIQKNLPDQATFRSSFEEGDIQALIQVPSLLIAADAYASGHDTLSDMPKLGFSGPPYIFRELHPLAFAQMVFEVLRRIRSSELTVPNEWKAKHADFYTIEHPREEW